MFLSHIQPSDSHFVIPALKYNLKLCYYLLVKLINIFLFIYFCLRSNLDNSSDDDIEEFNLSADFSNDFKNSSDSNSMSNYGFLESFKNMEQ